MKQVDKLEELSGLSYFDKNTLSQYVDVSRNSLYANIKRWLKNGVLVQLKRGLYVTREFLDKNTDSESYSEFIANKLHEPSYLSGEYILQQHNILTDVVFAFTSVTLKTKRIYENNLGRFIFRNIKDELFDGYNIVEKGGFEIKVATKSKSLFDYLYFKLFRTKVIDKETLESLRLNLDDFSKSDFEEFALYCKMVNVRKYERLPDELERLL